MKCRPILFNAAMVKAILDGRKTQTRRVVKFPKWLSFDGEQPAEIPFQGVGYQDTRPVKAYDVTNHCKCPFGTVGDRLWVRETFCVLERHHWHDLTKPRDAIIEYAFNRRNACAYCADIVPGSESDDIRKQYGYKWRPSIHMPSWASRITLEITGVRVERLQGISETDATAEGVESKCLTQDAMAYDVMHKNYLTGSFDISLPQYSFESLWRSINGPDSWAANPWVWVVEFQRVEQEKVIA